MSDFITCSGFGVACVLVNVCAVCVCCMCVLGSKVRPKTFGCVAMGSAGVVYFEVQIALIFCRVWMNLMIVHGILVCNSFVISVWKTLLISSATVIVRAEGAIWLNPFGTVLFNVCSSVTVECCVFVPVLRGYIWYVYCYVRKKALLQCFCNY